jgi:glycerophosphoryl diester phosphodiesterase
MVLLVAALAANAIYAQLPDVAPLPAAHAHNDYLHSRPLLDALDHGFTSVEVDVFPVDGKLLVGHDRDALKPERTLETLYLAPLAARAQMNGGGVYQNGARFFLLIDIKSDPGEAYRLLKQLIIRKYETMISRVEGGQIQPAAITLVLSGERPQIATGDSNTRYVGLDGRLSDLGSQIPPHAMPMISDKWTKHFRWNGDGPMPVNERSKLRDIVKQAHAAGRVVRFWATPENESVWSELRSAGVDLINTDDLARLATFLKQPDTKTPQ